MLNDKAFLLYESAYKSFERRYRRNKGMAADLINAVMRYGLYNELPEDNEENAEIWEVLEPIITSISSAKDRHERNKENGKKGGRPPADLDRDEVYQVKKELGTWKATAKHFGLDEDTLRKYRKFWDAETEKPKNRNDEVGNSGSRKTEKPKSVGANSVNRAEKPKNLSESESESESESNYSAKPTASVNGNFSLREKLAQIYPGSETYEWIEE
jgi:hypothetical protein